MCLFPGEKRPSFESWSRHLGLWHHNTSRTSTTSLQVRERHLHSRQRTLNITQSVLRMTQRHCSPPPAYHADDGRLWAFGPRRRSRRGCSDAGLDGFGRRAASDGNRRLDCRTGNGRAARRTRNAATGCDGAPSRYRASGGRATPQAQSRCRLRRRVATGCDGGREWGRQDSNLEPTDYESAALTD